MSASRLDPSDGSSRRRRALRAAAGALLLGLALTLAGVAEAAAQQQVEASEQFTVPLGNSTVITHTATLDRVSIGDPEVADAVVVSAREVVINGKSPGSTTLLLWDGNGDREMYSVRVTADAPALEREFERLFPGEDIAASALGNTVILTGETDDPQVAERASALAASLGEEVTVMDNIAVPDRGQVLLQVRFAEVSRNAIDELGPELYTYEGENVTTALGTSRGISPSSDQDFAATAFSDAVNFFLFHRPSGVAGFINALQSRGLFKSLAEPNLLAVPGDTASFLAGGEFPFPVLQPGQQAGSVTIQFKEFGIRLNFVPTITNSGAIRLAVAPEVSSLDFANALEVSGFRIPSLLSRRASTVIELRDGQTFAIAGLMDNALTENVNKVPLLGDIPVLGSLFRSEEMRQERTELLVLVTPNIVQPLDESPPVPTGEPETWRWRGDLHDSYKIEGSDPDEGAGR